MEMKILREKFEHGQQNAEGHTENSLDTHLNAPHKIATRLAINYFPNNIFPWEIESKWKLSVFDTPFSNWLYILDLKASKPLEWIEYVWR